MAKNSYPKVFPKPPQRLNSKNAAELGKNSNTQAWANAKAIYDCPKRETSILTKYEKETIRRLKQKMGVL